jgi:hypothetical protein
MSIKPLLDAGPGDRESREYIADIVQIAVEASTPSMGGRTIRRGARECALCGRRAATCPPGVPP